MREREGPRAEKRIEHQHLSTPPLVRCREREREGRERERERERKRKIEREKAR